MTTILIRALAVAIIAALSLIVGAAGHHPKATTADPIYCVVITDGQGHPVDTVCVPWPFGGATV